MEDKALLNDTFQLYYKKAKEAHEAGNIALAKRNYLLAAETMMKMALQSTNQLKKAQVDRAKRLVEISESLDIPPKRKIAPKGGVSEKSSLDTDEKKQFTAAVIPDISFDDVAGLDDVKRAITVMMINPVKHPEQYAAYGKKTGGGVLLYGPPGTGKTMIAKAIAHEVGAKFYAIKGSDIVSKWVGESESNINALFEQARADDRAIIFVDEMDSLFGSRGLDVHNDRRVNEFLQQIDGFVSKSPGLLLLGATNRPWDVDSAATRSGRFSQKIYIPLPDPVSRKFLFQLYTKKAPLDADVNISELVEATVNFSGADIAEICDRAKNDPLEQYILTGNLVKIKQEDFLKAITSLTVVIDSKEIERFDEYAKKR